MFDRWIVRPTGAALRGAGMALAVLIAVGACASAVATPTQSPQGTSTPYSSNSANPSPLATLFNGEYAIALGTAPMANPASDGGAAAGAQINDFGFDLFRRLDSTGNLCASPASIALALAMARPGARGLTATEMDAVLRGFGADGQAGEIVALIRSLHELNYSGDDSVEAGGSPAPTARTPEVEVDIANAAFAQIGMNLEQAYLNALSSSFGAGLGLLDYRNNAEGARQIINDWGSQQTKGRIPQILQPGDVDSATRIALANAIYVNAAWDEPFQVSDTHTLPFTRANGTVVSVPTMTSSRMGSYAEGSGWKALDLPYMGIHMSMTLVIPDDMAAFISTLNAAKLASIVSQESTHVVDLTLPRFSIETRLELAAILVAMGMPTAFNPDAADLSGITHDEHLWLDNVIHQANIDVTETGTTAAAITVVTGRGGAGEPPPPAVFHANKPFLYFIRDRQSGAVLFMGRVADPSAH